MKRIIDELKKMITAKALISTVSLGLFIPFAKLIYWVFDTSYLGGFGVSPDVYSRPVFSSGFVSSWLVAEAMTPILGIWTVIAVVLFVILFNANFGSLEKPENRELIYRIYSRDKGRTRFRKRFRYALSKSFAWPTLIWISGFILLFFLAVVVVKASERGRELAQVQMKAYADHGFCVDKFNSKNKGCFQIDGIEGEGLFVIANPSSHLIFLSRVCSGEINPETNDCSGDKETTLHIHEKEPNKQYSIDRAYKLAALPKNGGRDEVNSETE